MCLAPSVRLWLHLMGESSITCVSKGVARGWENVLTVLRQILCMFNGLLVYFVFTSNEKEHIL